MFLDEWLYHLPEELSEELSEIMAENDLAETAWYSPIDLLNLVVMWRGGLASGAEAADLVQGVEATVGVGGLYGA